jgi:hypothetical protein
MNRTETGYASFPTPGLTGSGSKGLEMAFKRISVFSTKAESTRFP